MVHGENRSTEGNSPSCYPRGRPLLLLTVAELPVPEHFLAGGTPELCEITAHRCGATGRAMRGIPQSPSLSAWRCRVDSSSDGATRGRASSLVGGDSAGICRRFSGRGRMLQKDAGLSPGCSVTNRLCAQAGPQPPGEDSMEEADPNGWWPGWHRAGSWAL